MLRHPRRTPHAHADSAAVVLNTVALCCGGDNLTASTRAMLRDLPPAVRSHANLYLVLEGTMRSARCYTELPPRAVYLTLLPFYHNRLGAVELGRAACIYIYTYRMCMSSLARPPV